MGAWKRFVDWYRGNNDKEIEPPRGGIKRVIYIFANYTGKMIVINLFLLIACIPVITIPAALSAANRYLGRLFRVGYGAEISDFWKEYKYGLLRYVPLGLFDGVLLFYSYYLLSLANNFTDTGQRGIVSGIGIGILIIGICVGAWCFMLTSMIEIPARHILKNAFILMLVEWKRSLFLAGFIILYGGILLISAPWSFIWFVVIGSSFLQLGVSAALIPPIKKRVIEPYEQKKGNLV